MATRRYAFGRADEATHPDSIRATLAEFASTFIFVFAGEGSGLAMGMYILKIYHLNFSVSIYLFKSNYLTTFSYM